MSTIRVLIVEDNRADARLLTELLSEVSEPAFTATCVGTLKEAVPHLNEHDVVLLDLSLPDTQGLSTIERMVAAGRTQPIVVLTGMDDQQVAMDALKAGAQDYLIKAEITPSLVARSVRYAIERKRLEQVEVLRARSEDAAQRARFLANVTAAVAATLEVDSAMAGLARLVVPTLADLAIVHRVRDGKAIHAAWAATSPTREQIHAGNADAVTRADATLESLRCAHPSCVVEPRLLLGNLADRIGASSMLLTPLVVRERVIGCVSYVHCESKRRHTQEDQLLAEEIAAHVALALDNAELFQQAHEAVRAREGLLAVVSHDLRGPLEVVSLALTLLERTAREDQVSSLTRARRAVGRMTRLIDDLLDIARIDAGTLRLEPGLVEIAEVLDEGYELHRPLATVRKQTLLRDYPSGLGAARLDRHRMLQVLSNLLGNALKFTPEGGTIRLVAAVDGPTITIRVEDSGPGIDPDNLGRIFDKFWQKNQGAKGVGLGLTIAKGIVEAHGGTIQVLSAPGAGATFHLRLPRNVDGSRPGAELPNASA